MRYMRHFISVLCCLMFLSSATVWSQNISEEITPPPIANTQEQLTENNFDPDFKKRYDGKKYDYEGKDVVGRSQGGSGQYEEFKKQKDPEIKEENNTNRVESDFNFPLINWIFILALVLAVVYLAHVLLNEGGQGLFSKNREKRVTIPEEITAVNIEQTDVDTLIQSAENAQDYRLAIRYYYLLVLKNLSLKDFIKLEDDKTNQEYFNEISHHDFSDNFAYTSYLYNYVWYGEFEIRSPEYTKAKSSFDQLLKRIGR